MSNQGPLNLNINLNSKEEDKLNQLLYDLATEIDQVNENVQVLNERFNDIVARLNAITHVVSEKLEDPAKVVDAIEEQKQKVRRDIDQKIQDRINLQEFQTLVNELEKNKREIPKA